MKRFLTLCALVLPGILYSQGNSVSFTAIDYHVQFVDASTPDSLARKLTSRYSRDLEKARAVYSWIAQNISYNTGIYGGTPIGRKYAPEEEDTVTEWKSGDEMTARKVLKRRLAVCDGYAKLFKTLCDYAGLTSEIILGYANGGYGSKRFYTNHSWNAVMIDSTWHLLDVTWGSGYMTHRNEFVSRLDETYFMTPPQQFIRDHFPEDQKWTLMENPPAVKEFKQGPFRLKSFIKYGIRDIFPEKGTIQAHPGDTILFKFHLKDPLKNASLSADPFFDSAILHTPGSVFLHAKQSGNEVQYSYIVDTLSVQWINLFYNGDLILRYRFEVKEGR